MEIVLLAEDLEQQVELVDFEVLLVVVDLEGLQAVVVEFQEEAVVQADLERQEVLVDLPVVQPQVDSEEAAQAVEASVVDSKSYIPIVFIF